MGSIPLLRTAMAPWWGAPPNSPAGLEAVCPGQQHYDEFTLEIPRSNHPGTGNVSSRRMSWLLVARGMTPRWGRRRTLPLATETQWGQCSLSGPLSRAERGSGELSENCRVSDHRGHHNLAIGSLKGRSLPSPASLAARQGRMGQSSPSPRCPKPGGPTAKI